MPSPFFFLPVTRYDQEGQFGIMAPDIISPPSLAKHFTDKEIASLLNRELLHALSYDGIDMVRLSQDCKSYPRGTVFHGHTVIPGYPAIMRILHLKNGIEHYFKDTFYIEEKVDGYNVRVAMINGTPLAFTRGGFVCPFTTDRLPDLIDLTFFDYYPQYTLCGEIVGPGNPYNTEVISYIEDDVVFFVFDFLDEQGKQIAITERYALLERFHMPQVARWGEFSLSDIPAVKEIILELDRTGREGIVVKPTGSGRMIKYVTPSSCLRDLQSTTNLIAEIPAGYYIQRILRAIFFSHEFDIPLSEDYLIASAKALYSIPGLAVEQIAHGGSIKETFGIKVRHKETIDKLLAHLNRAGVRTELVSLEQTDGYFKVRFHKIYTKMTRELRHRLAGKGFYD